ncbi:hypothetical protein IIE26_27050 (plasmid) [Cytobacillus oceanisediminis]|uniref:hypothetical protein n=1 Tax=Cytobacillus oceanisediminis TaxID=665099 RepID=UPI001865270F|nr:hypothetical protein [Cytobacillus oceanisediminis]QOK30028.1 hypothetical protein IIE26_27050 [Cytobacillus oceanisediminis]
MKAIFSTEKVKYELNKSGYSRNGHFVQGEVRLKQLSIGQPSIIEVKVNKYVQVIRTDIVTDIDVCPAYFKMMMSTEVHPYKISVIREDGDIVKLMKIGTEIEVREWISKKYPGEEISYRIAPIPVSNKGAS